MSHVHHFWPFTPYVQGEAVLRPTFWICSCGEVGYPVRREVPPQT